MSKVRAAIVIGVDTYDGDLTNLEAAADGAAGFCQWFESIGGVVIPFVERLDDSRAATFDNIRSATETVIESRQFDQIFFYFSGHGIAWGECEDVWLLPGVCSDPRQAINLGLSVNRAKYLGVDQFVFISDACRSRAPNTLLDAQGDNLFARPDNHASSSVVDVFYATRPFDPAFEVNVSTSVDRFSSLFTETIIDLAKQPPFQVLDAAGKLVMSRPLAAEIRSQVPRRGAQLGYDSVSVPDSDIRSDSPLYYVEAREQPVEAREQPPVIDSGDGGDTSDEDGPPPTARDSDGPSSEISEDIPGAVKVLRDTIGNWNEVARQFTASSENQCFVALIGPLPRSISSTHMITDIVRVDKDRHILAVDDTSNNRSPQVLLDYSGGGVLVQLARRSDAYVWVDVDSCYVVLNIVQPLEQSPLRWPSTGKRFNDQIVELVGYTLWGRLRDINQIENVFSYSGPSYVAHWANRNDQETVVDDLKRWPLTMPGGIDVAIATADLARRVGAKEYRPNLRIDPDPVKCLFLPTLGASWRLLTESDIEQTPIIEILGAHRLPGGMVRFDHAGVNVIATSIYAVGGSRYDVETMVNGTMARREALAELQSSAAAPEVEEEEKEQEVTMTADKH